MRKRLRIAVSTLLVLGLVAGVGFQQVVQAAVPGINTLVNYNSTNTAVASSGGTQDARISEDGTTVVWRSSNADVIPGITGEDRVYKRNLQTGATSLESVFASGAPLGIGNDGFSISRTGRYITYGSNDTGIVATHTIVAGMRNHVYLRDTLLGTNTLIDQSASGVLGNDNAAYAPKVSDDGRFVVFRSLASNLLSSGTLTGGGIFLRDMQTGKVTLLSASNTGTPAIPASISSPSIQTSCDGSIIIFGSNSTTLTPQDDGQRNVYIVDIRNGFTIENLTYQANQDAGPISISCSGRYIVFSSKATNITPDVVSGLINNGYRYDRITKEYVLLNKTASGAVSTATGGSGQVSDDGKVVFMSNNINMVSPAATYSPQVYIRDADAGTTNMVHVNSSGVEQNVFGTFSFSGASTYVDINARGDSVLYNTTSPSVFTGVGSGGGMKLIISKIN